VKALGIRFGKPLMQAGADLEKRVDERTSELELEMSDRQRAQEALHESEEQIHLLMDSTAEAIFGIDLEGIITFANSDLDGSTLR